MTRHHVLMFEEAAGFGGAFIDLCHIVEALLERGVRVTVVHSWKGPAWDALAKKGALLRYQRRWDLAERLRLASRGQGLRRAAYATDLLANLGPAGLRQAAWARRNGVTCVFLNNSIVHNLSGAIAARVLGVPLYVYFQGLEPGADGRLLHRVLPWMTRGFAVSDWIRHRHHELGVPLEAMDVLYPGVHAPEATQAAARPEGGTVRVGMVGMLTPWKGQLAFLEALALARREAPQLEGWLFGRAVPGHERYEVEVRGRIETLGLRDHVRIVSDRSTPEAIYPEVDFTVHSSIEPEPFGRVLIEAMSFARPVVAAREGGPGEVIRHGETGYRAAPTEHAEVATHMARLANDRPLLLRMGAAAREDVMARFSYPKVLEPVLARFT